MKGMQKIQRGSGFRGCAGYLLDHDDGRVIGGNMGGLTARALATEFGIARRLRPDIEKPVWHNSLRLPVDERAVVDNKKWREIGDDYVAGMGFTSQHQRVYVLHKDHIHILINRIGLDGKVYLGKNENLRSTGLIQSLEQVYGLTVTKGPKKTSKGRIAPPEVRRTRVAERRFYERLEEMPPRERLQQLVSEAAQGRPTASEFVAKLQVQGVSVWPKFTGDSLDGFSFGLAGVAFTGNQLGNRYRWGQLQKKAGVSYYPARDMDALLAARPKDPAVIAEVAEAVPKVEAEREAPAPEADVAVEQDRPAAGLVLTPEGLEESRRIEEEDRGLVEREDWMTDRDYANAVMIEKERIVFEAELEEIQAALDSPDPQAEQWQKVKGPGM